MNFKILFSFSLVFFLFASFGLGILVGINQVECEICPPEEVDFSLFWETYSILEERSAYSDEMDIQKIIYGAISGMLETIDDPYAVFFNPEETEKFERELSGFYQGVGIEIGIRDDELTVITPFKGSPAGKAGLRAGDKIVKINGEESLDFSTERAASLIRGEKGTIVVLTIIRENWKEPKDFEMRREEIQIPSLEWESKTEDIIYIHIYQFHKLLSSDFREAAFEILEKGNEKIILDLRNNPGGYLSVAVDIAGWFIERGEVVAIEYFGEEREYKSDGNAQFSDYSIVVLINEGSASGSEILAGALKYHNDATLVGEPSFGKGSIQEAVQTRGGSLLKLTTAEWLTPGGISISEKGLVPDKEVEITEEDYREERDPQLEKAIEILKNVN